MSQVWRRCSACKKEIFLNSKYYICSVDSCNKIRNPVQFCSPSCWDAHNAVYRHRDAGAMEMVATEMDPVRRIIDGGSQGSSQNSSQNSSELQEVSDTDILVVVSKVKKYISDRASMNTSSDIMPELTKIIIQVCEACIRNANRENRKTVLKRDIPKISV